MIIIFSIIIEDLEIRIGLKILFLTQINKIIKLDNLVHFLTIIKRIMQTNVIIIFQIEHFIQIMIKMVLQIEIFYKMII